jgi:solute carrier family 25 (mitochondrial phosphate transporter), member 23/24/25/41
MNSETARNLCCGGVSGVISRTIVSPLEVLKINFQVQHTTSAARGAAGDKYKGVFSALRLIVKENGLRGLYAGNGANAVRVFPYIALQFTCFSEYSAMYNKYQGREDGSKLRSIEKLVIGAFAGVSSVLVTYPLDIVRGLKTAAGASLEGTQYNSIGDVIRSVVKKNGPLGLYRGMVPTLAGVAPYVGVNFLVFETLKEKCPVEPGANGPSAIHLALCGGVAGTSGQTVAYPMDLLRRRFQMAAVDGVRQYSGVADAVGAIFKEEGFRGFYKGFLPNFLKTWPTIAIMFFLNSTLRQNDSVNRLFGFEKKN